MLINSDIFGVTEWKGCPAVSSRFIAANFKKRHDNVLRDIEVELKNMKELAEDGNADALKFEEINFRKSSYRDERGRKQTEYILTRSGFMSVVMKYQGKKATATRIAYIQRFDAMEQFIKNLFDAKAEFPEFANAIMQAHEEPKHYHFSNECNMINQIVTGMTAKQFRQAHGIEQVGSIRPYLAPEQIKAVQTLQRMDIGLILAVPDYQARKEILKQQYEMLCMSNQKSIANN